MRFGDPGSRGDPGAGRRPRWPARSIASRSTSICRPAGRRRTSPKPWSSASPTWRSARHRLRQTPRVAQRSQLAKPPSRAVTRDTEPVRRSASDHAAAGAPGADGSPRPTAAGWHWRSARRSRAGRRGEVPVGAVVVCGTGETREGRERQHPTNDPAGTPRCGRCGAGRRAGNYRLTEATLYATVEPCAMCMGRRFRPRVARLVFGCADPKAGAAGSLYDLAADRRSEPPHAG